jgi:hypothetical protein
MWPLPGEILGQIDYSLSVFDRRRQTGIYFIQITLSTEAGAPSWIVRIDPKNK